MLAKRIKLIAAVFLLFILQFSFFPFFRYQGAIPDLLAILVVFYAFYVRLEKLLVFAFFVGIFKDLFGTYFFGLEMLSYVFAASIVHFVIHKLPNDFLFFRMVVVSIFMLLSRLAMLVFIHFENGNIPFADTFWYQYCPVIVYTVLLSPFILIPLKLIMKKSLRQYSLF